MRTNRHAACKRWFPKSTRKARPASCEPCAELPPRFAHKDRSMPSFPYSSPQQPPVIFNGPHFGLLQVLFPRAAVAIPAVVRDIQQNLCALQRSLPHFVGKDRFITDEHSKALTSGIQWRPRSTSLKLSHFLGQTSSKGKQLRKRQIFAEGYEMHLVVASNPFTLRS